MEDLKIFELYQSVSGVEWARQAVLSRVSTQLGEMPFYSRFGTQTEDQVDEPNTLAIPTIRASIAEALDGTIPGVKLISVVHEVIDLTDKFSIVFAYSGEEIAVTL